MFFKKFKIKPVFIFLILFFLSRILFINTDPAMFDSAEYIRRFSERNLFTAVTSGHIPYHTGYIMLFWSIFNFVKTFNLNSIYSVLVSQVALATFSSFFFYKSVKILFDGKIAVFATIISSLLPLFWIANVNIMIETSYVFFFISSLYFLLIYLKKKKRIFLFLGSFSFGFSFFIQFSIILWLPFFLILSYFLNKKTLLIVIFSYLITSIIFGAINIYLLSNSLNTSFINGLFISYFSHQADIPKNFSGYGFLVYLRNFIIPFLRNNTNLIVVLGFVSLIKLFFSDRKIFWVLMFLILPSVFLNQAWDSLFFGRHSIIAGFGLAILTSIFIEKNIKYFVPIIIYLVFTTLPQMFFLKNVPYLMEKAYLEKMPIDLLVISHFERPFLEGNHNSHLLTTYEGRLEEKIDENLKNKKLILITSSAISDPYGLYSGPFLHTLSLSYKHSYLLEPLLRKYKISVYRKISEEDNLIIYSIERKEKSNYPIVKNMRNSRRRLDYFDPLTQVWLYLDKRFKILHSS